MSKQKTHKNKRHPRDSLSADTQLSLAGFRAATIPDSTCLKFTYSDYRVLTASVNQAEYVYRANSLFDPDQSGVGGQPDGFDQWKNLYGIYRVVALDVEVMATGNGANTNGLLSVAPSDTAGGFLSAEEVAGLRKGQGAVFSQDSQARIKAHWHVSQLLGRSDQAVLGDQECAALVTANPAAAQYVVVAVETGNSATGQTMVWVKLTYYARLERPIATLDAATRHRLAFQRKTVPAGARITEAPSVTRTPTALPSSVVPDHRCTEPSQDRLTNIVSAAVAAAFATPAGQLGMM